MKKILFNDKFCLTQAVLTGQKTMTRRAVTMSLLDEYDAWYEDFIYKPIGEEDYLSTDEYVLTFSDTGITMTAKEYINRRAALVGQAMKINKKFFPRCVKAKLRQVARLENEYRGVDYETRKNELYKEWFN